MFLKMDQGNHPRNRSTSSCIVCEFQVLNTCNTTFVTCNDWCSCSGDAPVSDFDWRFPWSGCKQDKFSWKQTENLLDTTKRWFWPLAKPDTRKTHGNLPGDVSVSQEHFPMQYMRTCRVETTPPNRGGQPMRNHETAVVYETQKEATVSAEHSQNFFFCSKQSQKCCFQVSFSPFGANFYQVPSHCGVEKARGTFSSEHRTHPSTFFHCSVRTFYILLGQHSICTPECRKHQHQAKELLNLNPVRLLSRAFSAIISRKISRGQKENNSCEWSPSIVFERRKTRKKRAKREEQFVASESWWWEEDVLFSRSCSHRDTKYTGTSRLIWIWIIQIPGQFEVMWKLIHLNLHNAFLHAEFERILLGIVCSD